MSAINDVLTQEPEIAVEEPVVEEPKLDKTKIVAELRNDQGDTIEFGGKTFKILSLRYDDYCEFVEKLAPFLEPLFSALNPTDLNAGINITTMVQVVNRNLPRMVYLMFHNQDQCVTEEWIKEHAESPFELGKYVFMQIEKNKIIEDFISFFELMTRKGIV